MTLPLFLITFFLIYGMMHWYVITRLGQAYHLPRGRRVILTVIAFFLICAPVLTRIAERGGLEETARSLAFGGYIWMGFVLLMCASLAAVDTGRLLLGMLTRVLGKEGVSWPVARRSLFTFCLAVSTAALLWGYYEALAIRTEMVHVTSPKIPKDAGVLRIAQVSDVHLGLVIREDRLGRILDLLRQADPHMVVSTGDLVDGQINNLEGLVKLWRDLTPPYGKIAVTGNHEYIAGIGQALEFTERSGFVMLRDDIINIGSISVAGVEDPVAGRDPLFRTVQEREVLARASADSFVLLLKHRPLVDKSSVGLFDLQLSGHVHRGQIFPFSIATWLYYPVHAGLARVGERGNLYVSRGTGTWGPPIRLLSPPEVTIIELRYGPETRISSK